MPCALRTAPVRRSAAGGRFGTGWLAFDPPNAPGGKFAGEELLVRCGSWGGDVSFHAPLIRETGSGSLMRVRASYEVIGWLFGGGQTALRQAMTAVAWAVAVTAGVSPDLADLAGTAATAMALDVPVGDFVAAAGRRHTRPRWVSSDSVIWFREANLGERRRHMPERDGYIPGVPCWVDTSQPDPDAALPFYGGLFGWEFEDMMPAGSPGRYFIARIRGGDVAAVGSLPEGAPPGAVWNTYVWVASADETAARVPGAGGTVVQPPFDVMDAGRMAVLADPEGAVFCVWEARGHKGAKIVNEHGALNFNGLATRDPEAARAFYGTVFGWRTLALPHGQMWTLPGYGDHLEERTPGLRQQVAQMGGPEGFIDVVAALSPIAAGDSATPPHWSVTFAVDDAESTAAKARELGGQVVSGPFDAPWTRMAVIKDPQGATFIASQFVPENKDPGA